MKSNAISRAVPFVVTALVLIVCLLLPLLFRGGDEADGTITASELTAGERAALYSRYYDGELQLMSLSERDVDNTTLINCRRVFNTIMNTLVMDEGETRVQSATGTNYYAIADGEDSLRFVEFYREWTGDWSNWLRVRIDMDTLDVYYLYYSAEAQSNAGQYEGGARAHVAAAGQTILLALGFTGEASIQEDDALGETLLQAESSAGDIYSYRLLSTNIYEDAAPSILVDLELVIAQISEA